MKNLSSEGKILVFEILAIAKLAYLAFFTVNPTILLMK